MSENINTNDGRVSLEVMLATILDAIQEYESTTGLLTKKANSPIKRLHREQELLLLVLQQAYESFCECVSRGYFTKDNRRVGHAAFDQLFRISQVRV